MRFVHFAIGWIDIECKWRFKVYFNRHALMIEVIGHRAKVSWIGRSKCRSTIAGMPT